MASNGTQRARILHLSDLHFGSRFDKDSWTNAIDIATRWRPNLVIITGDLVNSPWHWRMKWAKQEVSSLKDKLGCAIVVVPGNHDTRVLGLLPVAWISWIALGLAVLLVLAVCLLLPFAPLIGTVVFVVLLVAVLGLLSLRFCLVSFNEYFNAFAVPSPYAYANLGIELYAFDSATTAISGARGRIPLHQFVSARENQSAGAEGTDLEGDAFEQRQALFRIAVLHHHPLPIPYDDSAEYLMVADNAGAFLSEISRMKVRLIMHGHKHKRHFSRVTINANEANEHEVAVLSTGTATAGSGTQKRGHNFNLLELDAYGNMKVTPWIAKGGTFLAEAPFFVEQNTLADMRQYLMAVERHGIKCQSNVVRFEINGEGDVFQRHEFHGLHVERDKSALKELPKPITAKVTTGHIEGFKGEPLDQNSRESVLFIPDRAANSLTRQSGKISFGRNLLPKDKPLSFFFQYHALNALAMTKQQHSQMYGDKPQRLEYLQVALTQCPSEELDMIIKFPADFKVGGTPQLLVEGDQERLSDLEKKYENCVDYYQYLQLVIARIRHPPLNVKFKIQWYLTDAPPPGGQRTTSLEGEAEEMAEGLLRLASGSADPGIEQLLKVIEEETRKSFKLEAVSMEPIDISVMAYDKKARALRIIASNFSMVDWGDFHLRYGDGIAGRAYKMNAGRVFVRRLAMESDSPSYYYPKDGKPCDLTEVRDQVIMSVPLRHPSDRTLIYGILNIGSKNQKSKLQDMKESHALDESSEYREAVCQTCYQVFKERILASAGNSISRVELST